jgi:DNA-directed RNA polymerase subunit L
MNPQIDGEMTLDEYNKSQFTLSGLNVSFANAIRRTLLADIPVVVFKTMPHEQNTANFSINTSRLNNELLKQRLSCIPIFLNPQEYPLERLLLEVDIENNTDSIMYVTTENFKIKDIQTDEYFPKSKMDEIFPPFIPNGNKKYYIEFVRLRPRISDDIPGEKIKFTSKFTIGTAHDDSCFNVVGTCSYGQTLDEDIKKQALIKQIQVWRDAEVTKDDIVFKTKNWLLLDGMRCTKKDSFNFTVQSICYYSNDMLMIIACNVLINKLSAIDTLIDTDELSMSPSQNTIENSYDIILKNEDYTLGKVLEFMLYTKFFEQMKILTYCGFKKMHPHDDYSIIRLAYRDPIDKSGIKINLKACIAESIQTFNSVKSIFASSSKSSTSS